jgi:CRISPR/Cas system CSM-associated protein Csm3 (group 7 of RAMP superfamily)
VRFVVTFYGGFRVATGYAGGLANDTVDPADPLPGSALKGLMRAAARLILAPQPGQRPLPERDHPLVRQVFGAARSPSPWNWGDATPTEPPELTTRAHVRVDEAGSAKHDMLRFAQEVWLRTAQFDIVQHAHVPDPAAHHRLLACAAQAVKSIGGDRRRGLGWVSIRSTEHPVSRQDAQTLLGLGAVPPEGAR